MAFQRRATTKTSLDPVRVRTDGSGGGGADDPTEERLRARVQKSSAYEKYKASLHEFFDGNKPLPDSLKAMLATRPGAAEVLGEDAVQAQDAAAEAANGKKRTRSAKEPAAEEQKPTRRRVAQNGDDYAGLVDAVRRASSPREAELAVDALIGAGFALPPDGEVLSKALGHKDEGVITAALRGLLELADAGALKSPRLLRTRVDNVALLAGSREVSSLCEELKHKLV